MRGVFCIKKSTGKLAAHIAGYIISAVLLVAAVPAAGNLLGVQNIPAGKGLTAKATASAAQIVYYAKHSRCYHVNRNCRTLRRSHPIYKTTKSKTKRMHLRPCRICTRR